MIPSPYTAIASRGLQDFIFAHEKDDERQLVLSHEHIGGVPSSLIADQIAGRRKAKYKLPLLYSTPGIVYPPSINLEQASSEATARFKARVLLAESATGSGADLTGGFGIDSFFLSRTSAHFDFVEPNELILQIARHNHAVLGAPSITYHRETALEFLSDDTSLDFIYVDPSRRGRSGKVTRLADCEPDLIQLSPSIFRRTDTLLVKASPLLDLHLGLTDLQFVQKIFVVAVDNECREVLFLCKKNNTDAPVVSAVNIPSSFREGDAIPGEFRFTFQEEKSIASRFSPPLRYLYEPNAAILKSGAFKLVGTNYDLYKLHVNTHLYTSDQYVEGFPGRIFILEAPVLRDVATLFPDAKANVIVRNYPLRADVLQKKLKLSDGGEKYLIGFSGQQEKYLFAARRLN